MLPSCMWIKQNFSYFIFFMIATNQHENLIEKIQKLLIVKQSLALD